jgi:acetyl esterase/lipase
MSSLLSHRIRSRLGPLARAAGIVCTLAGLAACDLRRVADAVFIGKQFTLSANIPYDSGARHSLDVYRPTGAAGTPAPVIVFLYGGRWETGAKNEYALAGDAITRRGYVAVIPDYRLAPAVKFPAWIDDAAHALRWVHDSVARYGGDTARIYVVGHSAGAHTATVLSLDDRYLLRAGVQPEMVKGYVSLAGPVDTVWTDADVQELMGPREGWPATYPMQLVSSTKHPPLLLLHGGKDETVLPANSIGLAARINKFGGSACAKIYPSLSHTSIVAAFMIPKLPIAPVMDDVISFVQHPTQLLCGAAAPSAPSTAP